YQPHHCPLAGAQETRCKLLKQPLRQQNSISVLASLILLCNRRPILPSLCSCQGNGEEVGRCLKSGRSRFDLLLHDAFLTSAKYGPLDLGAASVRVGRTLLSAAFDCPCGAGLVLSVVEGPVLSVVEGVRQPQLKEGKGWASPPETIVRAIPRGALDRDTLDRCANCRNLDQLSGRAVWPSAPRRLSLATRTLDPYFPARRTNRQRPSEICSCAWRLLCWRPVPSA